MWCARKRYPSCFVSIFKKSRNILKICVSFRFPCCGDRCCSPPITQRTAQNQDNSPVCVFPFHSSCGIPFCMIVLSYHWDAIPSFHEWFMYHPFVERGYPVYHNAGLTFGKSDIHRIQRSLIFRVLRRENHQSRNSVSFTLYFDILSSFSLWNVNGILFHPTGWMRACRVFPHLNVPSLLFLCISLCAPRNRYFHLPQTCCKFL